MGGSTAQKRLRSSNDNSFDLNGQPTTSYRAEQDSYVPSTTIMASLNPIDEPVYNTYQSVPTNTTDVTAPAGMNDMWQAMGMGQTPSFGAPLPFRANTFGSSQGFFCNDISAVDYQRNFDPTDFDNISSVNHQHNSDLNVFGNNISAVNYQHDSDPKVFLSEHQQTGLFQIPPEYSQFSGYAFITSDPQFTATGETEPLFEDQQIQAHHPQQGLPELSRTQKDSRPFAIPPVRQTYRKATVGQSLSNVVTSAPYFFRPGSLNEYNSLPTFAAASIQQSFQNSSQKSPQPHQCRHNTPLNGGLLSEFEYSIQKQGMQPNHCIKDQIPQIPSLIAQKTQHPVASSAPAQEGEYRQQLSAKLTHTSRKKSISTDFDSVLEEQPIATFEVIDLTDNDQFPTPTLAPEGTNAPKKDDKLFDNYVSRFTETSHPVQLQLHNHEQRKGVDKPAQNNLSEKKLVNGRNSKCEWGRDLAIEKIGNEKGQGLGLHEQKTEAQKKREKNAEQRRKLKEKKRARENAQNSSADLAALAVMPNMATSVHIQIASAQIISTQNAPALTREALEALGPLTLAQSKQLWHPIAHAYMQWEPNQEEYHNLIRPGDLGDPMYNCAHEEPKCEVEPITCTHPCCRTGVPWKTKKDLLIKAARKLGDKEAEKRGFPRPKHTRGGKRQEAPSTQPFAAPAPVQFSSQLTSSQAADSIQAPIPVPNPNPKQATLNSGQLSFLQATNPSPFAYLQAQLQPNSQATKYRNRKHQREDDEPSAVPRLKRTSGWANQDSQPELPITGLSKKFVSASEPPKDLGGSGWASQDCEPEPGTQGVVIFSVIATGSSDESDDGEMNSLFDDDGLGSLFGDDDDLDT